MEKLYYLVNQYEKIYSLLYSPQRTADPIEKQIIDIKVQELQWSKDYKSFYYIWGWPGPDYNHYTLATYGKGWAFTKEEIIAAWRE